MSKQGTIGCWLLHDHKDWTSNSSRYKFGHMKIEDVAVEIIKQPDKILETKVTGLSEGILVFRRPMPKCETNGCHFVLTWDESNVYLYLNAQLEETKPRNCLRVEKEKEINSSLGRRIPKTIEQRMRDCEAHLFFLWDARRLYPSQGDRFKQIAAELRVLACETKHNHPLLLELMEELGFSYEVQPPGPPFDSQPIPMIGWRDDPVHQQLTAEIEAAGDDESKMAEALGKQAALRRPTPIREFIERGLAVFIEPREYSYRELTLAVAQQLGSSHEDLSVDAPLVKMQSSILGQHEGHVAPLIQLADLVLDIGSRFLDFLRDCHAYKPRYNVRKI